MSTNDVSPAKRRWSGTPIAFAFIGILLALTFSFLPAGNVAEGLLYPALALIATTAIAAGAKINHPPRRAIWYLFAVGMAFQACGNAYGAWAKFVDHRELPIPSFGDAMWLTSYFVIIVQFVAIVQRRTNERTSVLDALVVATGLAIPVWLYIIAPIMTDSALPASMVVVSAAYPAIDVLLVGALVSLAFTSGTKGPSYWLLMSSMAFQLSGDIALNVTSFNGTFEFGSFVYSLWSISFVLMGAAALHPSVRQLTERPRADERPPGMKLRLPMLAFSALLPLVVLASDPQQTQGSARHVIALGAAALFVMVLIRVGGLARQVRRYSTELDKNVQELRESLDRERAATAARDAMEVQLRHSQKLESVGRLAAGIAHEINTPVQFITDNVRFIEKSFKDLERIVSGGLTVMKQDPDLVRLINEIDVEFLSAEVPLATKTATDGLGRIASIVAAMKLFGGTDRNNEDTVDVNEALEAVGVITRNDADGNVDIAFDLQDVPHVRCNPSDLNQVWLNLLTNAIQAVEGTGKRGQITVTSTHNVNAGSVEVKFADNGCGIPESVIDKVFDPFFTTRPVGSGVGQGLTVCHSIIEGLGGSIEITSEVDEGTVVRVMLPAATTRPATRPALMYA